MVPVLPEAPLQELLLNEAPWLQEPGEVQLTALGARSDAGWSGAVALELGLTRALQVGLTGGTDGAEVELGFGLARGASWAVSAFAGVESPWTGLALGAGGGLSAAVRVGPLSAVAAAGAEWDAADGVGPVAGVAFLLGDGLAVPYLEGRYADGAARGALGVALHPARPLEIGAGVDGGPAADGWGWRAAISLTVEGSLGEEK